MALGLHSGDNLFSIPAGFIKYRDELQPFIESSTQVLFIYMSISAQRRMNESRKNRNILKNQKGICNSVFNFLVLSYADLMP